MHRRPLPQPRSPPRASAWPTGACLRISVWPAPRAVLIVRSLDRVCVDALVRNQPGIAARGLVRLPVECHRVNLSARLAVFADCGANAGKPFRRGKIDNVLSLLRIVGGLLHIDLPDT